MARNVLWVLTLGAVLGWVQPMWAADPYAPQPMEPNPIEQTVEAGRIGEMALFPAQPQPGYPGANAAEGRQPNMYPQRLPYPGSVEHWLVWNPHYIMPIPPYNYRTLLKNFPAQQMEGVTDTMRGQWAEPIEFAQRAGEAVYTGGKRDPVPVVRLKPGGEQLHFTLDPLPTGMYAVRLIAAIESEHLEGWKEYPNDVIITMAINDGPEGEVRHYALRQRGTDNFYSLGEFFFHVEDARSWEVTLGLQEDSNVDLLVHNVDVHDILAETAKQAGKKRSIHVSTDTLEANWARDEAKQARENHEARVNATSPASDLVKLREQHPEVSSEDARKQWRSNRDEQLWQSVLPGVFIDGPLKRLGVIRHAVALGVVGRLGDINDVRSLRKRISSGGLADDHG